MQSVGQHNKVCLFQFLGLVFWKKKFSVNKEEKTVIASVQSIYSLRSKIQEHSWRIIQNSNQIIFVLLLNNFGFSVYQLFEYSSGQEWNQILNDAHIYGKGLEDIFLRKHKQTNFVFIRNISYYSLIFLVLKQV